MPSEEQSGAGEGRRGWSSEPLGCILRESGSRGGTHSNVRFQRFHLSSGCLWDAAQRDKDSKLQKASFLGGPFAITLERPES